MRRHYARMFEDFDPAKRTSAEAAIRAAREALRGSWTAAETGSEH